MPTPKTGKAELVREKLTMHSPTSPPLKSELSPKYSPNSMGTVFKQPSANAADVAAHLKLLGDSLTIIGERLKEHEVNLFNCSFFFSIRIFSICKLR
jgi:hypothetical protein